MSDKHDDIAGYVKELVDAKGVAVVTVKDGWVFTFTKDHLNKMIENLGDSEHLSVFVKSTAKLVKN